MAPNNVDVSVVLLLSNGDEEAVVDDTNRELFVDVPPPNGDCVEEAPLPNGTLLLVELIL